MLYRSSMRRGISLEVIVEEDDNAEVSLDPRLKHQRDCSPNSCSSGGSTCEESVPGHFQEEKEMRRQQKEAQDRWRLLGKQRSLSCEILTILDVGDDELSQEQWEREARDWDLEEENATEGFAATQPAISRRKILEESLDKKETFAQLDDREMSVDDEELEGKIDFEEEEEDELSSYEEEEAKPLKEKKSEQEIFPEIKIKMSSPVFQAQDNICFDDCDAWITVGDLTGDDKKEEAAPDHMEESSDESSNLKDQMQTKGTKKALKEVTFSDEVQIEILESYESHTDDLEVPQTKSVENTSIPSVESCPDVINEPLPSVKNVKGIFDNTDKTAHRPNILEKLADVLDLPNVLVEEKLSNNSPLKAQKINYVNKVPKDKEATNSRKVHYKELYPEELPPPRTVASVRQLFERVPLSINHFDNLYSSRDKFDHVRSNPSSKILRFGREKHDKTTDEKLNKTEPYKSSTLPRPFRPSLESSDELGRSNPVGETEQPLSIITDGENKYLVAENCRATVSRSHSTVSVCPSRDCSARSNTTGGIFLRKPKVVSRFNVRKALEESPIYFHIRMEEQKEKVPQVSHDNVKKVIKDPSRTQSVSPQREKENSLTAPTYQWPAKEPLDRSDAESMSSETSDDSGVSKDFHSSILTKFSTQKPPRNRRTFLDDQINADHSFKWIDPNVLAKIRSVGTTVIFFGPRRTTRPAQSSTHRGAPTQPSQSLPDSSHYSKQSTDARTEEIEAKKQNANQPSVVDIELSPPRIVGVVRKNKEDNSGVKTSCASSAVKGCASSKSSFGNNSIVFDFTRIQAEH